MKKMEKGMMKYIKEVHRKAALEKHCSWI